MSTPINSPVSVGALGSSAAVPQGQVALGERMRSAGERFAEIGASLNRQDDHIAMSEVLTELSTARDEYDRTTDEVYNGNHPDFEARAAATDTAFKERAKSLMESRKFNDPTIRAQLDRTVQGEVGNITTRSSALIRAEKSKRVVSGLTAEHDELPPDAYADTARVSTMAFKAVAAAGCVSPANAPAVLEHFTKARSSGVADSATALQLRVNAGQIIPADGIADIDKRIAYFEANDGVINADALNHLRRVRSTLEGYAAVAPDKTKEKTSAWLATALTTNKEAFRIGKGAFTAPVPEGGAVAARYEAEARALAGNLGAPREQRDTAEQDYIARLGQSVQAGEITDKDQALLIGALKDYSGALRSGAEDALKNNGVGVISYVQTMLRQAPSVGAGHGGPRFRNLLDEMMSGYNLTPDSPPSAWEPLVTDALKRLGLAEDEIHQNFVNTELVHALDAGSSEIPVMVPRREYDRAGANGKATAVTNLLNSMGGAYAKTDGAMLVDSGLQGAIRNQLLASDHPAVLSLKTNYGENAIDTMAGVLARDWHARNRDFSGLLKDGQSDKVASSVLSALPAYGVNGRAYEETSLIKFNNGNNSYGERRSYAWEGMLSPGGSLRSVLVSRAQLKHLFANDDTTPLDTNLDALAGSGQIDAVARVSPTGALTYVLQRRLKDSTGKGADTPADILDHEGKPIEFTPLEWGGIYNAGQNIQQARNIRYRSNEKAYEGGLAGQRARENASLDIYGGAATLFHKMFTPGDTDVQEALGAAPLTATGKAVHPDDTFANRVRKLDVPQRRALNEQIRRFMPAGRPDEVVKAYVAALGWNDVRPDVREALLMLDLADKGRGTDAEEAAKLQNEKDTTDALQRGAAMATY